MASGKFHSESQNIGKKGTLYVTEMQEVLGYGGQRDPDPNQIECFLTYLDQTQKDDRVESFNKLLCQVCKASFQGQTSRRELLEHINSVHSFDVYNKGGIEESEKVESGGLQVAKNADESIKDEESSLKNQNTMSIASKSRDESTGRKDAANNSFKCYICLTGIEKISDFRSHLTSRHGNEIAEKDFEDLSYRCKKCWSTFPNFFLLRCHFFNKHTTLVVYRCLVCHVTLRTKKSLKIHYNSLHADKSKELHTCNECGKDLTNVRALKAHVRLKHGKNNYKQGFRCRICNEKFLSIESRKLHYEEEHLGESPFICNECGKGFSSKSGLYGHRQLHKTEQVSTCPYCDKIFNRRDSYHEHILIHVGPKHRCPHCSKEFVQRSNLVRHVRIHTGQKPYTCTFCDKRFSDKGACNSHIRVHTKEEQCACPYCGQTFTKKQKLKYHIRKHTGEGLMSCEICSKTFTNSFALKEHRAIHDRQTQTICVECGKAFNSAKYLQRHVALVHQESRDSSDSIRCPICGKIFYHQARLKSHLVTHLGKKHLQCIICEKRYSSMKSIRNHLQQSHEVRSDQPEFKDSVRSDFENSQMSLGLIESSSGDEKIHFDNGILFRDLDKTAIFFNEISKKIYNRSANEAETNYTDLGSSDEGDKKSSTIFTNEEERGSSTKPKSNLSAIIEDRVKVKDDRFDCKIEDNNRNEFLINSEVISRSELNEKETITNSECLNSEISRRRKQLRTPKKYVSSSVENLAMVEDNLKNVIPKRERVEAIARSLKKTTNLKIISNEDEEKDEINKLNNVH